METAPLPPRGDPEVVPWSSQVGTFMPQDSWALETGAFITSLLWALGESGPESFGVGTFMELRVGF